MLQLCLDRLRCGKLSDDEDEVNQCTGLCMGSRLLLCFDAIAHTYKLQQPHADEMTQQPHADELTLWVKR